MGKNLYLNWMKLYFFNHCQISKSFLILVYILILHSQIQAKWEGDLLPSACSDDTCIIKKGENSTDLKYYGNEGFLENFGKIFGDFSGILNEYGNINTLNNNNEIFGIWSAISNNKGNIDRLYNNGKLIGGYGIENMGVILDLKNNANIESEFIAIDNDRGIIDNLENTGKIIFKQKGGAHLRNYENGSVNISKWNLTISEKAEDFNSPSIDRILNEDFQQSHIILYNSVDDQGKTNNGGIVFKEQSIAISAGKNFEIDKIYDLKQVILNNNIDVSNAYLSSAFNEVNNKEGLKAKHFIDGNSNDVVDFIFSDDKFGDKDTINPSKPEEELTVKATINQKKAIATTLTQNSISEYNQRVIFVDLVLNKVIENINVQVDSALMKTHENSEKYKDLSRPYVSIASDENLNFLEFKEYYIFAMPYFNHSRMANGAQSNMYGSIVGLQKDFKDKGIFGIYFGMEKSDANANFNQEYNNEIFYFGINHLNYFLNNLANEGIDYFYKVHLKSSFIRSDIKREIFKDKANHNTYGMSVNFGSNIVLNKNAILSPELGMSYDRFDFDAYSIDLEHYDKVNLDLFSFNTALAYKYRFNEKLKMETSLGARFNLNRNINSKFDLISLGVSNMSLDVKLPAVYAYTDVGLVYDFNQNWEIAMSYNFLGAENLQSHTGYFRAGYKW